MRGYNLGALILATALFLAAGCSSKPKTECLYGDKIPQQDFESISNAAGDLIMLLEGKQWKELYESGTEELQTAQTRDQFKLPLDLFINSFGPVSYSRIEELYYLTSKSKEERVMIACNLGEPGVEDLYGMPANRELAVAVFTSHTDLEQVRVILTLEKEKGEWKLRSISLNPASMKKKTSDYYLQAAQSFREKNQLRLAALYYKAAMLLLDMGVNVNEYSTKVISNQLSQIKVDYLPFGEVQMWAMPSGHTDKVVNMDIGYDQGKLLVQVVYYTDNLADTEKLQAEARELAEYINQNFPEYRLGFDGVQVTAVSEKREEAFTTVHNQFLFSELPTPTGAPTLPSPAPPAPAPGTTAAPGAPAPAAPVPAAPAAGSTAPAPPPASVPAPSPATGMTAPAKP